MLARTGEALRHLHDGLLRGGEVVAQVDDGGADILKQRLIRVHDIGKLRNRGRRFIRAQVLAAVSQVDHDPGEVLQVFILDAQLATGGHDRIDFVGARCHLRRHHLRGLCQLGELLFCGIHGLAHVGKGRLKIYGCLCRRRAQRRDRGGDGRGQQPAHHACRPGAAGERAAHRGSRLANPRPCSPCCIQLTVGLVDLRARASQSGVGIVQRDLRLDDGRIRFAYLLRIVGLIGRILLRPGSSERFLIMLNGFLLKLQLLSQHGQLFTETRDTGLHIGNPGGRSVEGALHQLDLLPDAGDGGLALGHSLPGSIPVGLGEAQRIITVVDLRFGLGHGRLRVVQCGLGLNDRVGRLIDL